MLRITLFTLGILTLLSSLSYLMERNSANFAIVGVICFLCFSQAEIISGQKRIEKLLKIEEDKPQDLDLPRAKHPLERGPAVLSEPMPQSRKPTK